MTTLLALDADLGDTIAAGLLGPVPRDLAAFEQAFMSAVEAAGPDGWDRFYDGTLARLAVGPCDGPGTVATFSRIWSRARSLTVGTSALDVGSCFGFLPLSWGPGPRLLAVDLAAASAALLGRQARRLGSPVAVLCADGAALPLPDRAVDTVLLLHVLEHVPAATSALLLAEALRVAARRVVVAVPVEDVPDLVYGHLQVFDPASLAALGRVPGWTASVSLADGAWLVLDRRCPAGPCSTPHHPAPNEERPCRST